MNNQDIITIKAVNSHQKGKAIIHPRPNPYGGYYGVKKYSENEKLNLPFLITEDTAFELRHDMTINLADPYQKACWEFIKHDPILAHSIQEARDNTHVAQFYIDDEEKEYQKAATTYQKKLELSNWVNSMSEFEQREVCGLLDYTTLHVSAAHVLQFLLKKINEETGGWQKVAEVRTWTQNGYGRKVQMAKNLLHKGIVKKSEKYFVYNDQAIAEDLKSLIMWMENPNNAQDVRMMITKLKGMEKPLLNRNEDVDFDSMDRYEIAQPTHKDHLNSGSLENILNEFDDKKVQQPIKTAPQVPVVTLPNVDPAAQSALQNLADGLKITPEVALTKRPGRPKSTPVEQNASTEQTSNPDNGDLSGFQTSNSQQSEII
jgi:hypothetical protein